MEDNKKDINLITDRFFVCPKCGLRRMSIAPRQKNKPLTYNTVCVCFFCDAAFYARPQEDNTVTFVSADDEDVEGEIND